MFTARAVAAEEIEGVYMLVLAEHPDGSGARLEFQAGPHDEQDVALGMDTYCICTDSGACHYGGSESWTLENGRLTLALDAKSSGVLGVDRELRIGVPDDRHALVRAALHRILEG